tara:strand:+ start:24673 stop:24846 length:174 start_codon:yes stop_codon:yes gene_type:complete
MEIILVLLPISILLGLFFIGGFVWMTTKGQYDDLETPKFKMLLEDKIKNSAPKENQK